MEFSLSEYQGTQRRIHFIGICGVSMNAIAQALHARGIRVTGSDRTDGEQAELLRRAGIPVSIGHLPEYVHGADAIVRTAAIHDDSPDIAEARRLGIPVYERPEVLGALMREHASCVCVAGTHGKTTVTGMVTTLCMDAGLDPTVFIGANYPPIGGMHRLGDSPVLVAEACEYCDSFLSFFPETAVVLNIEADHLDYFKSIENIRASFRKYAERTPQDGLVIWNADDPNCRLAMEGIARPQMTFGRRAGDLRAENVEMPDGHAEFDLVLRGETLCRVRCGVAGEFQVYNALAASAAALHLGIAPEQICRSLSGFGGASRRMERKGTVNGADFYDDYAHHPSEIEATLRTARTMTRGRVLCAFQSHTYSRTKALLTDFGKSLQLADRVYVAPIFSAREIDDGTVSAQSIADLVPGSEAFPDFPSIAAAIRREAKPGDLVISMGAGDITVLYDLIEKQ